MFKALKAQWKAMTAADKAKSIIGFICDAGAGALMASLGNKLGVKNEKPLRRAAMNVTLWGLGACAGRLASNEFNAFIDFVTPPKKAKTEDNDIEEDDEDA